MAPKSYRIQEVRDDGTSRFVDEGHQRYLDWLAAGNVPEVVPYVPPPAEVELAEDAKAIQVPFTDRGTPAFRGNALAAIKKITSDSNGNLDYRSLPEFARSTYRDGTGKKQPCRDLGAMITLLTQTVQELATEIEKLKKQ